MKPRVLPALWCVLLALSGAAFAQNLLNNPSFESEPLDWWVSPPLVQVMTSDWNGVTAHDGNRFLAVSGPADVGYSYAQLVSQSLSAPFGTGLPDDNFLVYLYAATYIHTNDGRAVSYAMTIEPGYGTMGSTFHGGARDEWVVAQTTAYYYAHDPYDPASAAKPLTVTLELRDPLDSGEYLLLDNVWLEYGGVGTPEPSALLIFALAVASVPFAMRFRRRS